MKTTAEIILETMPLNSCTQLERIALAFEDVNPEITAAAWRELDRKRKSRCGGAA